MAPAKRKKSAKSLTSLFDVAALERLNVQSETANDHLNRYFKSIAQSALTSTPLTQKRRKKTGPRKLTAEFDKEADSYTFTPKDTSAYISIRQENNDGNPTRVAGDALNETGQSRTNTQTPNDKSINASSSQVMQPPKQRIQKARKSIRGMQSSMQSKSIAAPSPPAQTMSSNVEQRLASPKRQDGQAETRETVPSKKQRKSISEKLQAEADMFISYTEDLTGEESFDLLQQRSQRLRVRSSVTSHELSAGNSGTKTNRLFKDNRISKSKPKVNRKRKSSISTKPAAKRLSADSLRKTTAYDTRERTVISENATRDVTNKSSVDQTDLSITNVIQEEGRTPVATSRVMDTSSKNQPQVKQRKRKQTSTNLSKAANQKGTKNVANSKKTSATKRKPSAKTTKRVRMSHATSTDVEYDSDGDGSGDYVDKASKKVVVEHKHTKHTSDHQSHHHKEGPETLHFQHWQVVRKQLRLLREPIMFAGSVKYKYEMLSSEERGGEDSTEKPLPMSVINQVVKRYNRKLLQYHHVNTENSEELQKKAVSVLDAIQSRKDDQYSKEYWHQASKDLNFVFPAGLPTQHGATQTQFTNYIKSVESIQTLQMERKKKCGIMKHMTQLIYKLDQLKKLDDKYLSEAGRSTLAAHQHSSSIMASLNDAKTIASIIMEDGED